MATCPICCDESILSNQLKKIHCCDQMICRECIYSHMMSVFREGFTGDGRRALLCPLGCGCALGDGEIRSILQDKNYSFSHHFIGKLILNIINVLMIILCLDKVCYKGMYYRLFTLLTRSEREREELMLYERWSMSVSLLTRNEEARSVESVIRCPSPDCNYLWFGSTTYRRKKSENEPGNKSSILQNASSYLFYSPLKAEKIEIEELGCATEPEDGRFLSCPCCQAEFCGLCRRPWVIYDFARNKRYQHKGRSCQSYASKTSLVAQNGFVFDANSLHTKVCPGCGMRVERISGCNHMSCICGTEFCYVCESRWHPRHYSCRETDNDSYGCVIS